MKLLVLLLCFSNVGGSEEARFPVEGGSSFVSRVCGPASAVELSCPNNTWFHVLHKVSSNRSITTDNCSSAILPAANRATANSTSVPALVPECRGRRSSGSDVQLCNETVQVPQEYSVSGVNIFEAKYDCIDDNVVYNVCDDVSKEITSGDVYLASPSFYPSAPAVAPNNSCSCRLTTTDSFTAQALYVSLPADDWNVTCQQCAITFQKQYETLPIVNREIVTISTGPNRYYELHIEFQGSSQTGTENNELWIKFAGGSCIHLQCNAGSATTTTPAAPVTLGDTTSTDITATTSPAGGNLHTSASGGGSAHPLYNRVSTATTTRVSVASSGTTSTLTTPTTRPAGGNVLTSITDTSLEKPSTPVSESYTASSVGLEDGVLVVAGFIGGAGFVLLIGAAVYFLRRFRRRQRREESTTEPKLGKPDPTYITVRDPGYNDYKISAGSRVDVNIELTQDPNLYSDLQPKGERNEDDTNASYTPFHPRPSSNNGVIETEAEYHGGGNYVNTGRNLQERQPADAGSSPERSTVTDMYTNTRNYTNDDTVSDYYVFPEGDVAT